MAIKHPASGCFAVGDFAVDQRHGDASLVHLDDGDLEWIAVEHYYVGQVSGRDATRAVGVAHLARGIHREHVNGLLERDGLPQTLATTAELLAGDERFDADPRIHLR